MSKLNNLHFVEFWCGAKFRLFLNRAAFLNRQFYWKNQYSELLFGHGSCQYEQDDASHKGMGDDNSNFNLISKYGEEFETTF